LLGPGGRRPPRLRRAALSRGGVEQARPLHQHNDRSHL